MDNNQVLRIKIKGKEDEQEQFKSMGLNHAELFCISYQLITVTISISNTMYSFYLHYSFRGVLTIQ